MFGFLYALSLSIGGIISGLKGIIYNQNAIEMGKYRYDIGQDISNTYFDRTGIRRDINTNKIANIRKDESDICDDKYLWVGAPGVKTKNLSEEQRKIDFINGKNSNQLGRSVDLYDNRFWATRGNNKYISIIHGAFYKDLNNNNMYVCREFYINYDNKNNKFTLSLDKNNCDYICKFYMDITDGMLIRKADTQLKKEQQSNYKCLNDSMTDLFIKQFNEKQKNGGIYHGGLKYNKAKGSVLKKQNYYCNDFDSRDHFHKIIDVQKENNIAEIELQKEIYK